MSALSFLTATIRPAAAFLAGATGVQTDARAEVLTLAIAIQESGLRARTQANGGPGHGWWQFESEGVGGVLHHAVCGPHLTAVCERYGLMPEADRIWNALVYNDSLAFAVARLLLWTDPAALPAVGDTDGALAYYARNWRPQWWGRGLPEPGRWAGSYAGAMDAVVAGAAA